MLETESLKFLLKNDKKLTRIEKRIFQNEIISEKPPANWEKIKANGLVLYKTIISDCRFNEVDFSGT